MSLGARYHLHKKRKFAIDEGRPNSDINVTPLVDVVLVLLIIFMVVTPLLEKDIMVRVPDDENETVEEPDPEQLVVTIDEQGGIKLNSEALSDDDYQTRIKRALAAKPYDEKLVFFLPDDKAPYPRVVQVLDWTRTGGAHILGVVTEPVAGVLPGGEAAPGTTPAPAPGTPPPAAPATGGSH